MLKVIKYISAVSAPLGLLVARGAFALTFNNELTDNGQISSETDITQVIFTIIDWVLIVTGAFAVLMLIIGGFRYITSAGNESQVEGAKNTMTFAIIGLVIVLLAYVIATTINTIILGK